MMKKLNLLFIALTLMSALSAKAETVFAEKFSTISAPTVNNGEVDNAQSPIAEASEEGDSNPISDYPIRGSCTSIVCSQGNGTICCEVGQSASCYCSQGLAACSCR